ncbi:hypothetical protein Q1695_016221 [Nippostrongylus brasiliensis]|nr:hypothetical protein Q1695_016221 [Nippostrongylus brasiliensis]
MCVVGMLVRMWLPISLLFVHLPSTYTLTCNEATDYECDCVRCWDTVAASESLDWITVSLVECPLRFNDSTLRKRIASWINEECSASISCGLKQQMDERQIVVGHFGCEPDRNELRLAAILNSTLPLRQDNVLSAHLFGQVIQSREHLLSFLLHSEILAATVHRRLKGTPLVTTIDARLVLSVVLVLSVFTFFIMLLVYFSQIYVNWSRIVKGRWSSKEYRKVPHVLYSSEGIAVNGRICTRNI